MFSSFSRLRSIQFFTKRQAFQPFSAKSAQFIYVLFIFQSCASAPPESTATNCPPDERLFICGPGPLFLAYA